MTSVPMLTVVHLRRETEERGVLQELRGTGESCEGSLVARAEERRYVGQECGSEGSWEEREEVGCSCWA